MARDRARDTSRVYQNPISHVNVLPNEQEASPDDGTMGYGRSLSFKKDRKDKSFSDAQGEAHFRTAARHEWQEAKVRLRGAKGSSGEDHETANSARQDAYNDASSKAVNNRKEITKKGAEDVERGNKVRGKAPVVKVKS
jgi:hypothetical protein